jgi:hypothetical protein
MKARGRSPLDPRQVRRAPSRDGSGDPWTYLEGS